jgi:WD40 repeat protein
LHPCCNSFFKGAKFSPDGTCVLTCSDDEKSLRIYETPFKSIASEETNCEWPVILQSPEGESIYDYAWNPKMTSSDPSTCLFASTSRDHPVHLWDAFTGLFFSLNLFILRLSADDHEFSFLLC